MESNIFVSSFDPEESANFIIDKKTYKEAIIQSTELLNSSIVFHNGPAIKNIKILNKNNLLFIWTRNTRNNFRWVGLYFHALCKRYSRDYNKAHKYAYLINWFLKKNVHFIPLGEIEPFINYTPYHDMNVYDAYKKVLIEKWFNKTFLYYKKFFNKKEIKIIDTLYQNTEL